VASSWTLAVERADLQPVGIIDRARPDSDDGPDTDDGVTLLGGDRVGVTADRVTNGVEVRSVWHWALPSTPPVPPWPHHG